MREYGCFIDGKFLPAASGRTLESRDPATGDVVARVAAAGVRDARHAIDAARRAFDDGSWSGRSPEARRDALLSICDAMLVRINELAELEARDTGIPIRITTGMVAAAIQHARELTEMAARIPLVEPLPHNEFPAPSQNLLVREPYGVVTAITPFNSPLVLGVWKVFPALAMGNTVVLKPSPETPCTSSELAALFAESDVSPGAFNVLTGGGPDVGEELVTNPLVDRVAFTGSTEAGARIGVLAASGVKRLTLELGGKSPNIILDDADLDIAVPGSIWAMYISSGQVCQAGSRLFVPARLYDEVVDRIATALPQLRVGPTLSWETDLGPLVSQRQLDRVERYVRIGREEGASLACGGHRLTDGALREGFYYAPTVLTDVRNDMRIAQEEIFGPVLCVIRYESVDEAIALANDSIFGLAGGVWSRDVPRALAVARRLRAGTVWINDYHMLTTSAPYGGYGRSGLGKELGEAGVLEYVQSKHVWVDQSRGDQRKIWGPMLGLDRIFPS
ncbi:MAG: aldehyde dehydrogenase [Actinomycetota bacterium]|nr:aldehyde dehydrogenase family protein [Actinomycetota bacterium]